MASPKKVKKTLIKTKKKNSFLQFLTTNSTKRNALLFIIGFSIIGSAFLIRSFAASTVASLEAETMTGSGTVIFDNQAQGGKALKLTMSSPATGYISLPSKADKVALRAKATLCRGAPIALVTVDGQQVMTASVSSTTWTTYEVSSLAGQQSHTVTVTLSNPYIKKNCIRSLVVDAVSFIDTTSTTTTTTDTTPPTVSIGSPANGATVSGVTTISANATDNTGVKKVEFYINNVLTSTVNASPYNYSWDTTAVLNGSYQLLAKAYDAAGNVGTSAVNTVSVNNATAPQPTSSTYPTGCSGTMIASGSDIAAIINPAASGTTFCIASGVYRISTTIVPKANMVLWGNTGTILDGSKSIPATSWVQQGTYWVATGFAGNSNGGGQCDDNTTNPCLPTDQLFVNNTHLTRVMSSTSVVPGTFYIDYAANKIYIADNPTGKSFDIARTEFAIKSANTGVTVKGLTVQKFATKAQQGAVSAEGFNWKITGNTFRWNHAAGLHLAYADNSIVDSNIVTQNGQLGISHYNSQNVTISNNEITGNNTDGFWIADWESGGYKTTNSSSNFVNNLVTNNLGVGVWVDVDGKGVTIDSNTITNNAADGVRYEISYNGIIKNNTVSNNGFGLKRGADYSLYAVAGINVNTSNTVEIFGNTVMNNANGISLQMRNRGSGKYGAWDLTNATVHNNSVTMKTGTRWGEDVTGLGQLVSNNAYFTSKGNRFYDNTYYLDSLSAKRFAWNNTYNTPSTWKAAGQDVNGIFN